MTDMENERTTFERELNESGAIIYTNVGVSMLPLIKENRDILIIKKVQPENLKKYDVVLFKRKNIKGRGEYVLHRIVDIFPNGNFFIAGDNCTSGEMVGKEQILGVLASLRRGDKSVSLNSFCYKVYVCLWCAPYRLRFFILKTKNFVKYIFGAVKYKLTVKK